MRSAVWPTAAITDETSGYEPGVSAIGDFGPLCLMVFTDSQSLTCCSHLARVQARISEDSRTAALALSTTKIFSNSARAFEDDLGLKSYWGNNLSNVSSLSCISFLVLGVLPTGSIYTMFRSDEDSGKECIESFIVFDMAVRFLF